MRIEKGNEMVLSYQIEKKVKREFGGVGPSAITICRYVNANLQGMSPLKVGVKGDIPPCAFKSLCVVFESFVRIMQINSKSREITYKKLVVRINAVLCNDYSQKILQRILSATAQNLELACIDDAHRRRSSSSMDDSRKHFLLAQQLGIRLGGSWLCNEGG